MRLHSWCELECSYVQIIDVPRNDYFSRSERISSLEHIDRPWYYSLSSRILPLFHDTFQIRRSYQIDVGRGEPLISRRVE